MDENLVPGEVWGLYFALGIDLIILSSALSVVGHVSWSITLGIGILVHGIVVGYVGYRWWNRRRQRQQSCKKPSDPVAKVKEEYATGKITEQEFERRLDEVMNEPEDADIQSKRTKKREKTK